MAKLTNYKLTDAGEAYVKAASSKDSPTKGIIYIKGQPIDIRNLDDESAAKLLKTPYVEKK